MNNKVKVIKEDFKKDNGEIVKGVTIILDGILKDGIDLILENNERYKSEEELVFEALMRGLKEIKDETFKYN